MLRIILYNLSLSPAFETYSIKNTGSFQRKPRMKGESFNSSYGGLIVRNRFFQRNNRYISLTPHLFPYINYKPNLNSDIVPHRPLYKTP